MLGLVDKTKTGHDIPRVITSKVVTIRVSLSRAAMVPDPAIRKAKMAGRKNQPLSAAFVRTVKRPGRYGDGRGGFGLSLLVRVTRNGRISRMWTQRIIHPQTGNTTSMGLGSYPRVTLAEARRKALANRRALDQGKDPRGGDGLTFEAATDAVIDLHRDSWKAGTRTEAGWRNAFVAHLYPTLGAKPVGDITTADLLAVLGPLWHSKPAQAAILKRRISQVMRWAQAKGLRPDDPAGPALAAALPKKQNGTKHHKALHHSAVAEALEKCGSRPGLLGPSSLSGLSL